MKQILVLFFNLIISFSYSQKCIYYDAVDFVNADIDVKELIFNKYKINSDNKYFKRYSNISYKSQPISHGLFDKNIFSKFNITTTIFDGLARVIASRIKKELAINFFKDFKDKIVNNTKTRDLKTLFPNTFRHLSLVEDQIYNYDIYLPDIRNNLFEDTKNLESAFKDLVRDGTSQISTELDRNQNYRYVIIHLFELLDSTDQYKHFGRGLRNINFSNKNNNIVDTSVMGAFQTLQLISEAFVSKEDTLRYYINEKSILELISNQELLEVFMGLITAEARNRNIKLKDGVSLYDKLNELHSKLDKFHPLIQSFKSFANNIEDIINKNKNNTSDKSHLVLGYFDAINNFFDIAGDLNQFFKIDDDNIDKAICLSKSIISLSQGQRSGEIFLSISSITKIFNCLSFSKLEKLTSFLNNKSAFISSLITAESSDEVSKLIDNVIAPIGSWREKKRSTLATLDSYAGPSWSKQGKFTFSTPIGPSFSVNMNSTSLTLLGSIIDIGPMVAYRLRNDTSDVAKIYLNEIFAPGIFLSLSTGKNFPLFFNIGAQKAANLRKVDSNENEVKVIRDWWFGGSLNLNIPLYNLYKK